MIKITKRDALALLRAAVASRGADYVDPAATSPLGACAYAKGGGPGCIVGHALSAAGLPVKTLKALDNLTYAGMSNNGDVANHPDAAPNWLRDQGLVALTPGALKSFADAQRVQDKGGTWGEALRAAR